MLIRKIDAGQALRDPRGPCQAAIDHQPAAVLHQRRADEAEPARLTGRLLVEPGIRIGGRGVGRVRARLATPAAIGVPAAAGRVARIVLGPVLGPEALHRGPGVDQRAVDREMLPAHLPRHLRVADDPGEERRGGLRIHQPVPVLRESRGVPGPVVDAEPHEPAEQQVELQALHELALRAKRVERLQQQRPHQPLRRDRGAANPPIQRLEPSRQAVQHIVRDRPDHPQWVIARHPRFKVHIRKQAAAPSVRSTHSTPPADGNGESCRNAQRQQFFNTLLERIPITRARSLRR